MAACGFSTCLCVFVCLCVFELSWGRMHQVEEVQERRSELIPGSVEVLTVTTGWESSVRLQAEGVKLFSEELPLKSLFSPVSLDLTRLFELSHFKSDGSFGIVTRDAKKDDQALPDYLIKKCFLHLSGTVHMKYTTLSNYTSGQVEVDCSDAGNYTIKKN